MKSVGWHALLKNFHRDDNLLNFCLSFLLRGPYDIRTKALTSATKAQKYSTANLELQLKWQINFFENFQRIANTKLTKLFSFEVMHREDTIFPFAGARVADMPRNIFIELLTHIVASPHTHTHAKSYKCYSQFSTDYFPQEANGVARTHEHNEFVQLSSRAMRSEE